MLRTVVLMIWFFGYLFTQLPLYWKAKRLYRKGRLEEHAQIVEKEVKSWAGKVLKRIGVTLEVQGLENLPKDGRAVAFAANHQSYVDIPVILAGLDKPYALLSKKEIGDIPLMGAWMRELGCVFVQRDDTRSAMAAMRESEEKLAGGESVIIFPEGTRAKSDTMGEFKAGVVRMAVKAGVPIVPVAIDGTYKALEGNGFRATKCNVRLIVLPMVETQGLSRPEIKELPTLLENTIREAKDNRPALPPKQP